MGTTAQKLQRVLDTKESLKNTINTYLGQDITDAIPFKDYETYIKNFYNAAPKTEFEEGSDITLENTLKGKLDFENDIVGYGDTKQESTTGANLLPKPFATRTLNGITITNNGDGTYTLNGTATDTSYFAGDDISSLNIKCSKLICLPSNWVSGNGYATAQYTDNGYSGNDTGNGATVDNTKTIRRFALLIQSGKTFNNVVIKPMLTNDTTRTYATWEPYTNGASPNPSYPQEIEVVRGKNRVETAQKGYWNNEGIWVNDTAFCSSNKMEVQEGKTYVGSMFDNNKNYINKMVYVVFDKNDTFVRYSGDDTVTIASGEKYVSIRSYTAQGSYVQNNNFLLQFEENITHTSYLPYNTLEVVERGKNLFNPDITGLFKPGCSVSESNGEITITATQNGDIYVGNVRVSGSSYETIRGVKIPVKPNTQYTVTSTNSSVNKIFITEYNSNDISLGFIQNTTITTQINTSYITIRYGLENAVNGTSYKTKIMVAEGTDTTYEPYQTPQTYQLSLGDKELYTDSEIVRVSKNNFKFVDKFEKKRITGVPSTINTSSTNTTRIVYTTGMNSNCILSNRAKCNRLKYATIWSTDEEGFYNDNNSKTVIMRMNKSVIGETNESVSAYLEANETYILGELVTPIETPITDTTLINQLEEWYNSHSFTGTTIIEIDGQLPLIIKVRALKGE